MERELEELRGARIQYERDETEFAAGRLVLRLRVNINETELFFVAVYPDWYPYTRPELRAPDLNLQRHQHPFGKNLCYIGRATLNWDVGDTVAKHIMESVPNVLRVNEVPDSEEARSLEEPQGEPFTDHYTYLEHSSVLIDSAWTIDPAVSRGALTLGVEKVAGTFRGAVLRVGTSDRVLVQTEPMIAELYPDEKLQARWVRWHEPIRTDDARDILNTVVKKYSDLKIVRSQRNGKKPDIVGIVFPEEHERGKYVDGWVFIYRNGLDCVLLRACRAGRDDLSGRSPELRPLRDTRVVIAGLGTLGSKSAVELAAAGVGELRLVDYDYVEAGTTRRWALGLSAAGKSKVDALEAYIRANYPYTKVIKHPVMIGGAFQDPQFRDSDHLDKILDADLIYDATAEFGIQHLLSDWAAENKKPYILVSATYGVWGGMVARIRPGRTHGCWVCLQHEINARRIPAPVANDSGFVQVPGCASLTFTGAGFDIGIIALSAVRLAVSTLCSGVPGGYPDLGNDVIVIDLRDAGGGMMVPRFQTFVLDRVRNCNNGLAHANRMDLKNVA